MNTFPISFKKYININMLYQCLKVYSFCTPALLS